MSGRVFGIRTGLAVVEEPEGAEARATLRSFTFDGAGRMTVSVVELTESEVRALAERLAELVNATVTKVERHGQ